LRHLETSDEVLFPIESDKTNKKEDLIVVEDAENPLSTTLPASTKSTNWAPTNSTSWYESDGIISFARDNTASDDSFVPSANSSEFKACGRCMMQWNICKVQGSSYNGPYADRKSCSTPKEEVDELLLHDSTCVIKDCFWLLRHLETSDEVLFPIESDNQEVLIV